MNAVTDVKIERPGVWRSRLLLGVSVLAAVVLAVWLYAQQDMIRQYAAYGYAGIFAVSALGNATVVIPAPSFVVVTAVGVLLNPVWAGIAAGTGAAIGESTAYWIGRNARGILPQLASERAQKLAGLMERRSGVILFLLGAIPNPVVDIGGMIAGASGLAFWRFLLPTGLGKSVRFVGVIWVAGWLV